MSFNAPLYSPPRRETENCYRKFETKRQFRKTSLFMKAFKHRLKCFPESRPMSAVSPTPFIPSTPAITYSLPPNPHSFHNHIHCLLSTIPLLLTHSSFPDTLPHFWEGLHFERHLDLNRHVKNPKILKAVKFLHRTDLQIRHCWI